MRKCERFDLQRKVWAVLLSSDFDEFGYHVTLMAIKSRYAIAVGGTKNYIVFPDTERFARLDSLKLNKGWKILHLAV